MSSINANVESMGSCVNLATKLISKKLSSGNSEGISKVGENQAINYT